MMKKYLTDSIAVGSILALMVYLPAIVHNAVIKTWISSRC